MANYQLKHTHTHPIHMSTRRDSNWWPLESKPNGMTSGPLGGLLFSGK